MKRLRLTILLLALGLSFGYSKPFTIKMTGIINTGGIDYCNYKGAEIHFELQGDTEETLAKSFITTSYTGSEYNNIQATLRITNRPSGPDIYLSKLGKIRLRNTPILRPNENDDFQWLGSFDLSTQSGNVAISESSSSIAIRFGGNFFEDGAFDDLSWLLELPALGAPTGVVGGGITCLVQEPDQVANYSIVYSGIELSFPSEELPAFPNLLISILFIAVLGGISIFLFR